jgi:hypothetical protein
LGFAYFNSFVFNGSVSDMTMERIFNASLPAFHPDSGINGIAHRSIVQAIDLADDGLHPAGISGQPQLAQLFPLASFEDFIWMRLTPEFSESAFLHPARFRKSLLMLRSTMSTLATADRTSSRRYGKLARLLDDQDELYQLARMYFCSLLQG